MPSHAGPAWGKGYPYLTMNCSWAFTKCQNPVNYYTDLCSDYPMDPTNEKVYDFLDQFIGEVAARFPDQHLHLGGDEVKTQCWDTPEIIGWMEENDMNSFDELEQYFLTRVQQFAVANNKV
jgi:N-acetyl-beta-hexosaminidase